MSGADVGTWEPVARVDDVPTDYPLALALVDGRRICLVRVHDEVFAVEDRCPHRDFPLSGGDVVNGCLECPFHGARFDVRTGNCVSGPSEGDAVKVYPVLQVNGVVLLGGSYPVPGARTHDP
ncbi:Rieske 2Fe-2S domain-containing protein [Gemmatimonas sp.]|uniref:Rieske (2Fe-2S) protein n=1 Tax=Gemmatimonas sp. TaxID=1962908 RepID=UPI0027B8BB8D|nr:Rieske 2Fe-2S domain-containing protein [Gemmatimonas sp.]